MRGQRELHENAMYGRIFVEFLIRLQYVVFGRRRRERYIRTKMPTSPTPWRFILT